MTTLKNSLKILTAFFLFTSCIAVKSTGKGDEKVKVSGTVTQTFSYCGGARPSNEMLAKLAEPKPFANKKLFIKKGKTNDINSVAVVEVVADSAGNFSVSLPSGDYCIVDEFKSKSNFNEILKKYEKETTNYSAVDPECLKNWFSTPDAVFTVTKTGLKDLNVAYHHPCSWRSVPCANYRGPLPP